VGGEFPVHGKRVLGGSKKWPPKASKFYIHTRASGSKKQWDSEKGKQTLTNQKPDGWTIKRWIYPRSLNESVG